MRTSTAGQMQRATAGANAGAVEGTGWRTPAALTALACLLGVAFIGRESMWLDEAFSLRLAGLQTGELRDVLFEREANMSLYHVLLHGWRRLNDSDAFARSLSVLFAAGAVPLVHATARRLFGGGVAAIAGLLLVLNAFFVEYAQEARGYTLALLGSSAASWLFVRAIESRERRWALAWGAVGGVALYAHLFVGLVVVAHVLSLVAVDRRVVRWRWLAGGVAVFAVLAAPLALFALSRDSGQIDWIPEPSLFRLAGTALLAGGVAAAAVYLPLAIAGGWRSLRTWQRPADTGPSDLERWRSAFILLWLATPVVVSFAASFVKPIFVVYYLIVSLPPLTIVVALGISGIAAPALRSATLAAVVVVSLGSVAVGYATTEKENWRSAAGIIEQSGRPGDGVVLLPYYLVTALEHYLDDDTRQRVDLLYPDAGWGGYDAPTTWPRPPRGWEQEIAANHARVWVISSKLDVDSRARREAAVLTDRLAQTHVAAEVADGAIDVVLFERREEP